MSRCKKWYKVLYEDGDEEELNFRELRVKEWKPIPRAGVLWLDEKVMCPLLDNVHMHTPNVTYTCVISIKR